MRKLYSGIFLVTAVSVGLGAFGHGHQWSAHVQPALPGLEPHLLQLLKLVWYWVSGAMFTLGVLLVWVWSRLRRGDMQLRFVPWVIGVFYLVEGIYGAAYLGPFFLVFAVQAVLLFGTSWLLQTPQLKPAAPWRGAL
jgi:hypothetical protein